MISYLNIGTERINLTTYKPVIQLFIIPSLLISTSLYMSIILESYSYLETTSSLSVWDINRILSMIWIIWSSKDISYFW